MKFEMFKELQGSKNDISSRVASMLMTLILLLAFALGADGLNRDIIVGVELNTAVHTGTFNPPYNLAQTIDSLVSHSKDHVPFYFFLGGLWGQIAGWSQVSMRLMSCFFGVLMAAWLYRFAADVVNRRTAVVAALLMSTSANVIVYFHISRMYTLFMLLAVAHIWFYWRLAHGFRTTRLTWILFILTAGLLFYTHLFSVILFAGLGVCHLLFAPKSRRWLNIMLGWVVGGALFLPYVPLVLEYLPLTMSFTLLPTNPPIKVIGSFARLLVNGLDILWLPLMLSLGYALRRRRPRAILGLLAIALTMIVILLLASWRFDQIAPVRMQYFLNIWIPVVILFAYGLTSMPRWPLVTGLFLLLWGIVGVQLERSMDIYNYTHGEHYITEYPPLHNYARSLNNKTREGDVLIGLTTKYRSMKHSKSYNRDAVDYYVNVLLGIEGEFIWSEKRGEELESDVRNILDEHPYALLLYDPSEDPVNYAETVGIIQEDYIPCAVLVDKSDLLIQRYARPAMGCGHESGG